MDQALIQSTIGGATRVQATTEEIEASARLAREQVVQKLVAEGLLQPSFEVKSSISEAETRLLQQVSTERARLRKPLLLTLNPGERVIGPPYDTQWGEGGGVLYSFGEAARKTGELGVFAASEGFSACGIGVFLDAPLPLLAAVSPAGTYDFSQMAAERDVDTRSRAGLAVLIYEVGNNTPLVHHEAVLWDLRGTDPIFPPSGILGAAAGSGAISDAVVASTVFGPMRLAPILFNMNPGTKYVFWVWLWSTYYKGKASFFALLKAQIPLITTSAGPPLIIR